MYYSVIESTLPNDTKLVAMNMYDYQKLNKEKIQVHHGILLKFIKDTDLINIQKKFDNQLKKKFLGNFMTMFEKLLIVRNVTKHVRCIFRV